MSRNGLAFPSPVADLASSATKYIKILNDTTVNGIIGKIVTVNQTEARKKIPGGLACRLKGPCMASDPLRSQAQQSLPSTDWDKPDGSAVKCA